MNSELLARLMAADPAERQWLLLESVVAGLSPEMRQAVWSIAVPHWFDDRILAALCPELATQAAEIYQELQALSFVEVFEERGHNIHEATRSLLLDRLWTDRPEEFKLISARAAEYFENDAENVAEWLYHKAIGSPIGDELNAVMLPLDHNFRRSESEAILKALKEQIGADRVDKGSRERLHYATEIMLSDREESRFPPIIKTIERHLKQYKLRDRISPHEIFNEACHRAIQKCEKGEEIPNIPAWFRATCFYIVSEKSREFHRRDSVIQLEELVDSQLYNASRSTQLDILAMQEIYQMLSPLDQRILYLQASGLSWEEVADHLIRSGDYEGDRKQVTQEIAQRASRARRLLQEQYYG